MESRLNSLLSYNFSVNIDFTTLQNEIRHIHSEFDRVGKEIAEIQDQNAVQETNINKNSLTIAKNKQKIENLEFQTAKIEPIKEQLNAWTDRFRAVEEKFFENVVKMEGFEVQVNRQFKEMEIRFQERQNTFLKLVENKMETTVQQSEEKILKLFKENIKQAQKQNTQNLQQLKQSLTELIQNQVSTSAQQIMSYVDSLNQMQEEKASKANENQAETSALKLKTQQIRNSICEMPLSANRPEKKEDQQVQEIEESDGELSDGSDTNQEFNNSAGRFSVGNQPLSKETKSIVSKVQQMNTRIQSIEKRMSTANLGQIQLPKLNLQDFDLKDSNSQKDLYDEIHLKYILLMNELNQIKDVFLMVDPNSVLADLDNKAINLKNYKSYQDRIKQLELESNNYAKGKELDQLTVSINKLNHTIEENYVNKNYLLSILIEIEKEMKKMINYQGQILQGKKSSEASSFAFAVLSRATQSKQLTKTSASVSINSDEEKMEDSREMQDNEDQLEIQNQMGANPLFHAQYQQQMSAKISKNEVEEMIKQVKNQFLNRQNSHIPLSDQKLEELEGRFNKL